MKISILCNSEDHPINPLLQEWAARRHSQDDIEIVRSQTRLSGGDILFLVSCSEKITAATRKIYSHTLVIHASNLPNGRGWSPHIWAVVGGAEKLMVTLLEAEDEIDCGDIWYQVLAEVPSTALWNEINEILFAAELELMEFAIKHSHDVQTRKQNQSISPTYYRRRTQEDSRIDPDESIEAQFDLLRVCDPDRYPAFFEMRGRRYKVRLEAMDG